MKNTKEELIEKILLENYNKYYRVAFSYVGNKTDAMDIVQENVYKAIYKSNSLKNIDYIDTWIYRIIINEAKNNLNKISVQNIEDLNIAFNDSYENIDLKNALKILEELYKTIIILKFFEDLTFEDISKILEINTNTYKYIKN